MSRRHLAAHAVVLSFVLGLAAGCDRGPERPNLLIVTLDTTRADHFGYAGFPAATTPRFDAFSRERAVRFTDAISAVPITLPSHTTIMTGTYPVFHGVHDNDGYYVDEGVTTLAEILRRAGYATAAVIASFPLDSQFRLDQGFDHYDDDYQADSTRAEIEARRRFNTAFSERAADRVNLAVSRWLAAGPPSPFFLWVHYFDPHSPYAPPPPYNTQFATSPYAGEIAFMDEQFGRLLGQLDDRGLLSSTAVVVVGDHGEALDEHGELSHAAFTYDSTMRVPLLVAPPGELGRAVAGREVTAQVRTVDVAPTALALLGLPPHPEMQGRSLVPLMHDPSAAGPGEALLESYFCRLHFGWAPLRALRHEGWKYVQAPRPELYDLRADPGELTNLARRQPERAARMARRLGLVARENAAADPGRSAAAVVDDDARRKLAALGYVTGSSATVRKSAFPAPAELSEMINPQDRVLILQFRNLALELFRLGRYEDSLAQSRRGLGIDPDNPPLLLYLGRAQAALGNFDKALVALRRATGLEPESSKMHVVTGGVLQLRGDYEAAVEELAIGHRLDPTSVLALRWLASAHAAAGHDEEAVAHYQRVIELDPNLWGAYLQLARIYHRIGRLDEARATFARALELNPYSPVIRYRLGLFHRRLGELADSRRMLESALEIAPDDAVIRLVLAEVLSETQGEEAAARRQAEQVLRRTRDSELGDRARSLLAGLPES